MEVNRKELLETLARVMPALSAKELIEQSDAFVFTNGCVHTYNDELAIAHPTKFSIEGAVKAKELYNLLNKTKEEVVDIEGTETGMVVKGKRFKATIQFHSESKLPTFDPDKIDGWSQLPLDFVMGIRECLFSIGRDMSEPVLTCLHATGSVIESCDRFRLTRYTFVAEGDAPTQPFEFDEGVHLLIPGPAAKELTKFSPTEYTVFDGWIHFLSEDGTMFSCRTYNQLKFPDLDKLIALEGETIKFPPDMDEMLSRASVFADKDAPVVDIVLESGKILVKGEKESGSFEEWCRVRYAGEAIQFFINPEFLLGILQRNSEAVVTKGRLKFSAPNFDHVCCTKLAGGK